MTAQVLILRIVRGILGAALIYTGLRNFGVIGNSPDARTTMGHVVGFISTMIGVLAITSAIYRKPRAD